MSWFDYARTGDLPLIRQTEAAECGLACLAMISSFHGHRVDLNALRRRHPVSMKGVTLRGLIQIASQLQLSCRPLRFDLKDLAQLRLPAILHWDMNHFVVLKALTRRGLVIHNPASGEERVSLADASKHFTGVGMELVPTTGFKPRDERERLSLSNFWGHVHGLAQPLTQTLALSVVLQLLVIAAPFYMQLTMDEVIGRGDSDLLPILALGFLLVSLITVATTALRSYVVLALQNFLHFQLGARLFHHLLRLPLSWFEKRHVGDVLSRFGSLDPIRRLLAEGLIVSLVDGVMALATLTMIFVYSPQLAGVVLAAVALYTLVRVVSFQVLRRRNEAVIEARGREQSLFIETIRAAQSIKLFNRESERESQWLNRYTDMVNANVRLGRAQITYQTLNGLIFGLENVLVIYLAARLALDNTLTVGMVFAFIAYKLQFIGKTVSLVDRAIEFRLLGLHLERLADIALAPLEPGQDQPLADVRPIRGEIELRNVSFRYAETDRFVIENMNLKVQAGEFLTVSGPSGSGKTTMMKICLGLLAPTSGEVLVDGIPLQTLGVRGYREQVAAVMQDDQLLSGSIADNIAFFDAVHDEERMLQAARLAGIHEEVLAMPMGYGSLVGDMGSALSGGQKQRLLLARALYRQPRILFMDEGTAHLDVENERSINERLQALSITRISIAHRSGMAQGAHRMIQLGAGAAAEERLA
jgi:ATP-binding cassette, subfamily B, bacterial CvaB/MchF/RaxB